MTKAVAVVLAGGCGSRLLTLTAHDAKPALDFAGGTRIIDIVLSKLVNPGIRRIDALAQYKPRSLVDHVLTHWAPVLRRCGEGVQVVLPDAGRAPGAFLGTPDAVHKTLHRCAHEAPDQVAVFAAVHVHRMDVGPMVLAHERRQADIRVATVPGPLDRSASFGIVERSADGRILACHEKPAHGRPMPGRPGRACASMGDDLFNPAVLRMLLDVAEKRGEADVGRHLLARACRTQRVFADDFPDKRVTATLPHEEPHYWRDVGAIEAYRAAEQDAWGPVRKFSLDNDCWPIGGDPGRSLTRVGPMPPCRYVPSSDHAPALSARPAIPAPGGRA